MLLCLPPERLNTALVSKRSSAQRRSTKPAVVKATRLHNNTNLKLSIQIVQPLLQLWIDLGHCVGGGRRAEGQLMLLLLLRCCKPPGAVGNGVGGIDNPTTGKRGDCSAAVLKLVCARPRCLPGMAFGRNFLPAKDRALQRLERVCGSSKSFLVT